MNENLQLALTEIINKAISGIDTSVEFMKAELPDVITQLLTWYAVYNGAVALASLLVIIAIITGWIKVFKWMKKDDSYMEFEVIFVLGVFSLMIIMFAIFSFNLEWLQILIAPKIWLIEYASTLVK